MNSRRELEPFPSPSLGRTGGSRLRAQNDPLLSSASPRSSLDSSTGSDLKVISSSSVGTSPPRYVPYTPRHRLLSSTTTLSTNPAVSMSSPQIPGGATEKLQMQNMKAAAQAIGLTNGTLGWAILDKLAGMSEGSDWEDLWKTITKEKVCLKCVQSRHEVDIAPALIGHIAIAYRNYSGDLQYNSGCR